MNKGIPQGEMVKAERIEEDGESDVEKDGTDNPGYRKREKREQSRES